MSKELKPVRCGCGGEARIGKIYGDAWTVECTECGIQSGCYDTEAEAITAWNRAMGERTAKVETYTDDQQETWSVCECGTDVWKSYNYCPECGAKLEWSEE